jgi:hypothetical protein
MWSLVAALITALWVDVFDPGLEGSIMEGALSDPGLALVAAVAGAGASVCYGYLALPVLLSMMRKMLTAVLFAVVVFAIWTAVDVSAYLLHAAFLGWVWASVAVHALGAFRPEYAPKHRSDAAA